MQKYDMFGRESEQGIYYRVSDVDAVLKRQASAAIAGMNAATAISSGQLEQAHRLRAESSPEALESERQANAILTERVAELEQACKENARYSAEMREEFEQRGEEIQKLQKALRFWLPHVPPEDSERGNRIANDTYLLAGYQGEIEADAEERGWIRLTELMGR